MRNWRSVTVRILKLINYVRFLPVFEKWFGANQKFKVFRRFSNQLSLGGICLKKWNSMEFFETLYSGTRPMFKTGVRPTNQPSQTKYQTNLSERPTKWLVEDFESFIRRSLFGTGVGGGQNTKSTKWLEEDFGNFFIDEEIKVRKWGEIHQNSKSAQRSELKSI